VTPRKDFFGHLGGTLTSVIKELTPKKLKLEFEEIRSIGEPG
jgi:hypothetical protein